MLSFRKSFNFTPGALLLFAALPARAITAYMTASDADFGTIDLNTGVFSMLGVSQHLLAGLGEVGGTLYGVQYSGFDTPGRLYSVNTANGSLTTVGDSSLQILAFGSTLSGLFALTPGSNLEAWSINRSTGAATDLGSTGLAQGGDFNLSTNSSTLYLALGANTYTINTTTGAATLIGPTGGPQFGGLVWDGSSVLYGGQQSFGCDCIDTINTSTGQATAGPAITGTSDLVYGLAPLIQTPEPATLGLLGIGLTALALLRVRARQIGNF